jgi:phosphoribosylaminoimidazole-succinocarboxamide synthase
MKLIKQGKVRDIYDVDEHHLMLLATDRLSAYDVIFSDPFPGKGVVLTDISKWWLARVSGIVPTHWQGDDRAFLKDLSEKDWLELEDPRYRTDLPDRAMLVTKCDVIPFECVVRGYAFGSYLKAHPEIKPMTPFDTPMFTPTTKAETGHDMPVTYEDMASAIGGDMAWTLRDLSIALFLHASAVYAKVGIVLVDTKFEFGRSKDGTITLIDECFTPDSSRFILKEDVDRGHFESYDKQVVRDYVDSIGWNRRPPAPTLPADVIQKTMARYTSIRDRLMGVQE